MVLETEKTVLIPPNNGAGNLATDVGIQQKHYIDGLSSECINSVPDSDVSSVGVTGKTNEMQKNLSGGNNDIVTDKNTSLRFYVTISVILIIFKGCEEMTAVTLKQFVYSWCENSTVSSKNLNSSNTSDGNNSTDPCGHTGSKATESEAQKMASRWELYFNLLNSVLVFFSVSIFGTISDFFGRKPFLCLALLGYALKCGIISAVIYYQLHIVWVLLAYGVDGLGGSSYAISLYTYACTADLTQRSGSRILIIALMEMVLGAGKVTTLFGNGYFIKGYGYFYPMLTTCLGSFFCVLICLSAFKETLKLQHKNEQSITCTTIVSRYVSFYLKTGSKRDKTIFWLCLVVFVLFEFGLQGRSDPIILYQLGSPFCWSSEEIGWYGALSVALWYVIGCPLLKPLQFCFHTNKIACIGIVSAITYNVVTGLAPDTLWIFIGKKMISFKTICMNFLPLFCFTI
jgi:MFS family permease